MLRKFICNQTDPIVKTQAGKIRGYQLDGTYVFHGIKYADAKRFQAPTEVESWEGVKDALSYGWIVSQSNYSKWSRVLPGKSWRGYRYCRGIA